MLIANNIATIFIESLRFSLCLNNTRIPSPALDSNPAITAPKLKEPLIKSMVRAIETAQFGTSPIIAVNTGARILIPP